MTQLSFFDIQKPKLNGKDLRDKGIQRAIQHAENIHGEWQKKALDFLYIYVLQHRKFSGEMVRTESKGIVPDPPSLRAWGGIMVEGAKRGWIKQIGYIHVLNPRAHKANAAFWESMLCL